MVLFSFHPFFHSQILFSLPTQYSQFHPFLLGILIILILSHQNQWRTAYLCQLVFWSFISIRLNCSNLEFHLCFFNPSYFKLIFFSVFLQLKSKGIKVGYSCQKQFLHFSSLHSEPAVKSKAGICSSLQLNSNAFDSIVLLAFMFSTQKKVLPLLCLATGAKKSSLRMRRRKEMGNGSL